MTSVIVGWATEDRFEGAVITADATPLASYSLDTFGFRNPAERIRFAEQALVLTATLAADARGDVLVIPCCNIDAGDADTTGLRLTNSSGLDVPVPVPALRQNGIPRTIALDLTDLADEATLTADVWNLEITGNSVPLTFGGFLGLFAKRTIEAMQWGIAPRVTQHALQTVNEYGGRYRVNFRTQTRALAYTLSVEPDELTAVEDWHDANAGLAKPGLLWVVSDELEPMIGTLEETQAAPQAQGMLLYDVAGVFTALSKGKPV